MLSVCFPDLREASSTEAEELAEPRPQTQAAAPSGGGKGVWRR